MCCVDLVWCSLFCWWDMRGVFCCFLAVFCWVFCSLFLSWCLFVGGWFGFFFCMSWDCFLVWCFLWMFFVFWVLFFLVFGCLVGLGVVVLRVLVGGMGFVWVFLLALVCGVLVWVSGCRDCCLVVFSCSGCGCCWVYGLCCELWFVCFVVGFGVGVFLCGCAF